MEITVKIDFTDRVANMFKTLLTGQPIIPAGKSAVTTPTVVEPPPEAPAEAPNVLDFSTKPATWESDKAKRNWFVKWCESVGKEIPARTRTDTLEKWYDNAAAAPDADAAPDAGGDDDLFGDPAPETEKEYTHEDVNNCLRAYLGAGVDETDKVKRRTEVKAFFATLEGATMVNDLNPKYYGTVVKKFGV
jgi:hypothetical protein